MTISICPFRNDRIKFFSELPHPLKIELLMEDLNFRAEIHNSTLKWKSELLIG